MKKNDFILIGIVLFLAVSMLGYHFLKGSSRDSKVIITIDGDIYGTYDLSADQIIDIDGMNTLVIQGGEADMEAADCRDKLCVYQKAISRDGESIICLPNKIVVAIEGGKESELDGVAN